MAMKRRQLFLLVFYLDFYLGVSGILYRVLDDTIVLNPEIKEHLYEIMWHHDGSSVVDFNGFTTTEYDPFKGRVNLNSTTGELTIHGLTIPDSGTYKMSTILNSKVLRSRYEVEVIEPVPKPKCNKQCKNTHCVLTCDGVETKHTQYKWMNNKGQEIPGKEWNVSKTDEMDTIYTCNVSNPVSSDTCSESESHLFPSSDSSRNSILFSVSTLVLILVPILVFIIIILCVCIHVKKKMPKNEAQWRCGHLRQEHQEMTEKSPDSVSHLWNEDGHTGKSLSTKVGSRNPKPSRGGRKFFSHPVTLEPNFQC